MRATILLVLLVVSGAVAAQTGPDPAYDDGLDYASDYLAAQADNATANVAGYAVGKATPDNATREAAHAAYMACWIADDQGVPDATGVCANYYTAPEDVGPLNDGDDADQADQAVDAAENVTADLNATLDEVADAVNDTVADPASAPDQLQRILTALAGFAQRTVATVVALVTGIAGGIVDTLTGAAGLAGLGVGAAGQGLVDLGGLLGDGSLAVGDGIATGATASWDGTAWVGGQVADGASAAGRAVGDAAGAAAGAVADGVSAAAKGIGDAVVSAVNGIADAFEGLFGGGSQSPDVTDAADGALDGVTDGLGADGLLDPVRDIVDG